MISTKHKHAMVKAIYSSFEIQIDKKMEILAKLGEEDKSNWFDNTKSFCEGAHPTPLSKQEAWESFFKSEFD